ncbi:ATP-dependent Clp protease proteolytic subunit [Adhaeretor mobilis]|uniref:ATP-dependent Clp protease proteolytic subunit 1 n=1 Tax=Adhaeretor mobilis TaxID=1930276 RepID=A0A517N1M7_9BACT|nr:ATP-dependent Clp protease proteolytic subunit [Adhaeretor mobilis]QDT01033.1 ATP-dependent Clp protease proteolytic subunit 1 [Adhaeretor mobilis]
MTRLSLPFLLAGLLMTMPCSTFVSAAEIAAFSETEMIATPVFGDEIPDDWEEQIDKKTEEFPDEVRETIREKLKAAVRKRLSEEEASGEETDEEADDSKTKESESDEKNGKEKDEETEKKETPKKDLISEEAKKLKAEMELDALRFKHQVAMYEKELAAQRLLNEKSKIDRKLEAERIDAQKVNLERERDRIKLEIDLLKQRSALDQAKRAVELAASKAEQEKIELEMKVETTKEQLEDRILGDESYPDEPFQDGVLSISLRRIELNGPIMTGAADYVCQRLDYFNNQSRKPIFLVIDNCPGGSAIEGMQIVQSIKKSEAPVHVVVKRFAASMAAIITTLADHSYCYPDAIILHHQASTMMYGNGRAIKDQVRQLEEISHRLIGAVAEKQGLSEEEFVDEMYENRISGDWELFGNQAVEQKWVDHVATTIREQGIRTRPKGMRVTRSLFSFGGEQAAQESSGYQERYEVFLKEQVDNKGQRFVKLPRLSPIDAWLIYNPDEYYR